MKPVLSVILCLTLLLTLGSGCSMVKENPSDFDSPTPGTETSSPEKNEADSSVSTVTFSGSTNADMFTERDMNADYEEDTAVKITLNGSSATASSDSVRIDGSTITITEEATYLISGSLENGMIIVNVPDKAKPQLVFHNVSIASESSAPLYILEGDKVFLTLVGENTLTNGGTFTAIDDNNIDAVIFSKQDLTINGSGSLSISSPAGHGIVGKDDLVLTGGTYTISAASHAIDANDSVRIKDADITTDSGKDGIHAENSDDSSKGFVYIDNGTFDITSDGDGISSGAHLLINNGSFRILAGGGYENGESKSSNGWGGFGRGGFGPGGFGREDFNPDNLPEDAEVPDNNQMSNRGEKPENSTSMKGIKAAGNLLLAGGTFSIDSADDAIHSDTSLMINNGSYELASGDDAIHAEETLTVLDGSFRITNSYEGLEALHIVINGGDITSISDDDGLNAAGGTDSSGTTGGRDGRFGGGGFGGNSDGSIIISGGTLSITASGDGIDANGTLEITGGNITIAGPTQGDTATLDYDKTGVISGGTFIGTGSSMMPQSLTGSGQGVIAFSVNPQEAGTAISITDGNNKELLTHAPALPYEVVIFSSPDVVSGETYTIHVGSVSGEITVE